MSNYVEIPLSASGVSAGYLLTRGRWAVQLVADSFDSGKPIGIQYAMRVNAESRYEDILDPETDAAFARTAAGRPFIFECARGYVRLSVPDLGTTENLRLECNWVGV